MCGREGRFSLWGDGGDFIGGGGGEDGLKLFLRWIKYFNDVVNDTRKIPSSHIGITDTILDVLFE